MRQVERRNVRKLRLQTQLWLLVLLALIGLAVYLSFQLAQQAKGSHHAHPLSYYYNNENIKLGKYMDIQVERPKVLLVNKEHSLPADYIPNDLVAPQVPFMAGTADEKRMMEPTSAAALEALFAAAEEDGIRLMGVSAYRSYTTQNAIYHSNLSRKGYAFASVFSAEAGKSEHQTGMAIDLSAASVGYVLSARFAYSTEGQWLKEHCNDYGFIIRYPEDSTDITGYTFEPWHIRYVGEKVAHELTARGITLDEYEGAQPYEEYFR